MAVCTFHPAALLLLLLLLPLPFSAANLHLRHLSTSEDPLPPLPLLRPSASQAEAPSPSPPAPTTFFEVTRPVPVPPAAAPCSTVLLRRDFASTYTKPPATAPYSPPAHCPDPRRHPPSKIVLEWSAACRGRQFDRIFGIWLGGVELLRSCTAEPRPTGIVWSVRKDVSRYAPLFAGNHTLAVYLGNVVDKTYTGVYHVNLTLHFYYEHHGRRAAAQHSPPSAYGGSSPADLILPISRDLPLNDGQWFLVENSTDAQAKEVAIPRNAYRAVLEVYVSFHSSDEFWYGNPPNDYIAANNLTGLAGNGPFREVTATVDGDVVGAVWPFTVIYTGGVNPLLWRPITGIGSFDLPTYDLEITPFLGKLLDGKPHKFGFTVTNALNVWFIDANLHLWLDSERSLIFGGLIEYQAPAYQTSEVSNFTGLDGDFSTTASRRISSSGWVMSSHGKITTHFSQVLEYSSAMEMRGNGSTQLINQTIDSTTGMYAKSPSSILYSDQAFRHFPLYLFTGTVTQGNSSYSTVANISFGFEQRRFTGERSVFSVSTLSNLQKGDGEMTVKGSLVTGGVGSTQQVYRYESTEGCYFRNVSSSNYTILFDDSGEACGQRSPLKPGRTYSEWIPYPLRRASLAFDSHN